MNKVSGIFEDLMAGAETLIDAIISLYEAIVNAFNDIQAALPTAEDTEEV